MKEVYLIPGFMSSDLLSERTGRKIWWNPLFLPLNGLAPLRLAANGIDPQPPDGEPMNRGSIPTFSWRDTVELLTSQLDIATWKVQFAPWDWRKSPLAFAIEMARWVRLNSSPTHPATLIGHSAGGLVAVLVWRELVLTGQSNLIRRVISICSPFAGSYGGVEFLGGISDTVRQILQIGYAMSPLLATSAYWTLKYISNLALTWPTFYYLWPALGVPEAAQDPNRVLLYDARYYPSYLQVSQDWLDSANDYWQSLMRSPDTHPPEWVMTSVVGDGCVTSNALRSRGVPINFQALGNTWRGDGVVTSASATRSSAAIVEICSAHDSAALNMARSGLLAQLVIDPRGPVTPPPPPLIVPEAMGVSVSAPPNSESLTGLTCLSGG